MYEKTEWMYSPEILEREKCNITPQKKLDSSIHILLPQGTLCTIIWVLRKTMQFGLLYTTYDTAQFCRGGWLTDRWCLLRQGKCFPPATRQHPPTQNLVTSQSICFHQWREKLTAPEWVEPSKEKQLWVYRQIKQDQLATTRQLRGHFEKSRLVY